MYHFRDKVSQSLFEPRKPLYYLGLSILNLYSQRLKGYENVPG
ncbi:hypothetical protein HMPREF0208_04580 [Citrobacter koseri]|nr:hypothetical protein HMPREF3220_04703 [Citrobacter koseri]KWZ98723.1 hypothetical protein HMPREF3207_04059 [Citrobacter koseri]KXB39753.1 hypothetical protein HMPREF0208_04580 [Citrobacter koseri]